jgi:hypothetical protein
MLPHFLLHKSYYLIVIALIQQWLGKMLQCDNLPAIINLNVITYIKQKNMYLMSPRRVTLSSLLNQGR